MKKCFSRYRIALFALSVLSSALSADQIWQGTSASSVIDHDITIKGDVVLGAGGTRIEAVHRDITVTVSRRSRIFGSSSGQSQLYLMAAAGRTIRFEIDHNLTFLGSESNEGSDLLVVQSGPGTVEMALSMGKEFSITSEDGSGGVQMYVLMYGGDTGPCDEYCQTDEYCSNQPDEYCMEDEYCSLGSGFNETSPDRPTLRFVSPSDVLRGSDMNSYITIGKHSRLSYLSSRTLDKAQDSGYICFDPSSEGLGRMVLTINDRGAFIVTGHYTCQRNGGLITLNDINSSISAGNEAIWSIENSRGEDFSAGLLVLNENNHMSDLLVDPFLTSNVHSDVMRSGKCGKHTFSGNRLGVVVGSNGILDVGSLAYLDYVGLALNQSPDVDCVSGFASTPVKRLLKMRNPSALIIDGNNDSLSTMAQFILAADSAVFFRSGVSRNGSIRPLDDADPFTVDPSQMTEGFGNIVLDVEGQFDVNGTLRDGVTTSKIELLSLEVFPAGGSLFVNSSETNFPIRTFNTDDEELLGYNKGAFLINNIVNLYNTALSHTDVNHVVIQDNDIRSEPTYIGGEIFNLLGSELRPNIRFFNSDLLVHSDIALTGLDLVVPNLVSRDGVMNKNAVDFTFFNSGACANNGNGRNMILGTRIGSTAADGSTRINGDAHIKVVELFDSIQTSYPAGDTENQILRLKSGFNSLAVASRQAFDETSSINTIYLGNASNINIGVNADSTGFNKDSNPWLSIEGNYFSFTTRGGLTGCPETSNITGQGGIFVDLNGKLSIEPGYVASFCVMVTKSHNGIVDLPASQVFFCDGLGVTSRDVDLSNPENRVIVPAGQRIADYVLNWNIEQRDCENYSPYQPGNCTVQPATEANVASLPIIQGTVDNLIIQGSRFGDPAAFIIDGGIVRNIEFAVNVPSQCISLPSGQAPVATVILRNNGALEISEGSIGTNGIMIIADGSGLVTVNGTITIGSGASIVKGPHFAEGDILTINAATPQEIILSSSGSLDLSSFDSVNDVVDFAGAGSLIAEPGSRIITGLGALRFSDNAQLNFEEAFNAQSFFDAIVHGAHDALLDPLAVIDAAQPHNQYASLTNFGAGLKNTDSFRVRLMGLGVIELRNNAKAILPNNAFVGVESYVRGSCSVPVTNLELRLLDNAQFLVGDLSSPEGGVFQVGNVADLDIVPLTSARAVGDNKVSFTLTINGLNAGFSVGSQGFMGLGVGIERFYGTDASCTLPSGQCIVPNENIVNTLYNVKSITFNFLSGRFEDNRIFSGDDARASLFALSSDTAISYTMNLANLTTTPFNFAGGGNMALIVPGVGGIHPIVFDKDGQVEVSPGILSPRLSVGILASTLLQNNVLAATALTGQQFFDLLKAHDAVLEPERPNTFGRADAATLGDVVRPAVNNLLVGVVSEGTIIRDQVDDVIGAGETADKLAIADKAGAVFVNIDQATNQIITVSLIEQ